MTSRLLRVGLLGLLGRHERCAGPLLGGFADPERVTHLGEFGLGITEPGFELACPRSQVSILGTGGRQLAAHQVGEVDVFLRTFARLRRHAHGELRAVPGRRLAHLENDGVEERSSTTGEDQVDDDDETGAYARDEGENGQRGRDDNETGGGNAPAGTSRPVLALGYSCTHAIHVRTGAGVSRMARRNETEVV
jgi:hypothetical protein